ncbi:unnamed protein product [Cylicocyclus nassatus]|uniref:Uncharacterized protein n=1 Tax=Cylicocyclus nassatus TaxID=53992 RepID=A0AA36GRQ5_CYLNA|nr:unnamed protein product [Cylicocyclus nassatus]
MFRPRNSTVSARVRPGTVARTSHSPEPRRLLMEPVSSLYDCISRGTIHMDKAAKLILEKKKCHTFNQSVYDEFTRSEVANRAQKMVFDGIDNVDDPVEEMRLNDEKLKDLPSEIEDVLIDFAQDALGYGHEELVPGFEGDLETSSFYESLGNNEEERRKELSQMRQERAQWRPHLY